MSGLAIDGKEIATLTSLMVFLLLNFTENLSLQYGTPLTDFVFEYVNKEDGKTLQRV